MSDFITPIVGNDYLLGGQRVTVVEALKKRFWRIVVRAHVKVPGGDDAGFFLSRTIPEAEWRAKAANVGAGP